MVTLTSFHYLRHCLRLLGFFPLLSMINRGPIRNYQRPEGHCPVKPWLGLPVVSLFAPETINEMLVFPTVSSLVCR